MKEFDQGTDLLNEEEEKLQTPKHYTVMFHNDSYTTMEFVVMVVMKVFHLGTEEAQRFMIKVHQSGLASIGDFTYDIAKTKADQVMSLARTAGFPLRCSVEELPE